MGMTFLAPDDGFARMFSALRADMTLVDIYDVDWQTYAASPAAVKPQLLYDVCPALETSLPITATAPPPDTEESLIMQRRTIVHQHQREEGKRNGSDFLAMMPHEVSAWLRSVGLSTCAEQFLAAEVCGQDLAEFELSDLLDFDAKPFQHRKLLRLVQTALNISAPVEGVQTPFGYSSLREAALSRDQNVQGVHHVKTSVQLPPSVVSSGKLSLALKEDIHALLGADATGRQLDEHATFSELGIDSLLTARLRTKIEERLGVALPGTALVEHPTLATLASFLATLAADERQLETAR
jgi:acyl carrier protein